MPRTKGQHFFLIVAFLAVIYGVPCAQAIIELSRGQRPGVVNLFLRYPTEENLRAYETDMKDTSWFAGKLRPWTQSMQFLVLHNAGEKALLGRNQWFFYKPGIQYLVEAWPPRTSASPDYDDVVAAVTTFRDQLANRGIRLLVVPVPGKPSIYPDMLTPRAKDAQPPVYVHTSRIISQLREAGVEVVDLFEVLSQARTRQTSQNDACYYLARDTHWSPEGMRLAAGAVAQKILDCGWIKRGAVQYGLKWQTVRRPGDLLQMMQVPRIEHGYEPETIRCAQVVQHDGGTPYADEAESPLLVLGDSFLRIYERDDPGSAGFIAHLGRELGMPLASIVNDGGASTLVRQQLSRKPELLRGKKLVVWEFIERDIRFGTEGWQSVPLPAELGKATLDGMRATE